MKTEDILGKINELQLKFDSLKDNMTSFQQNINNNITWFYMVLTIIVTVLLVALYFLVKNAVSMGVEKGIEKVNGRIQNIIDENKEFLYANGSTSVSSAHGNLVQVYGLLNFNKQNFVSLTIVNKHGRVCEYHSLDIRDSNGIKGFDVKVVDYSPERDGMILFWNVTWLNNYEN
ncbi:hypothetical protein J5Y03_10015 [Bacillus sp. RG28]|uniref:Uncharacterized protein n=1 Tax=Gottfriedia endophytica TaxID=2820819 RepID=A0A940SGV8_9BACI|nr:hypothetical protein [Gottfriedia endophytica]MBP0725522.1 hypothetical protein [Gottfriedia endophytica]